MVRVVVNETDYSEWITKLGNLRTSVSPGLDHLSAGDVTIYGDNSQGTFDQLFSDVDLEDSIKLAIYHDDEDEALFSGMINNTSIQFNRSTAICSFQANSFSKLHWEKLDRDIPSGYLWQSEWCKKRLTSGVWCYDILLIVLRIISYMTGIPEENIMIDTTLNQTASGVGSVLMDVGVRYRYFRNKVGTARVVMPENTMAIPISSDNMDNHEILKIGDKIKVSDENNETDCIVKHLVLNDEGWFNVYIEEALGVAFLDPAQTIIEFLPPSPPKAKEFLESIEKAVNGIIEFGDNSASFKALETIMGVNAPNLADYNHDINWNEIPVPEEHRALGFAWKREIPDDAHGNYSLIAEGTVTGMSYNTITDNSLELSNNQYRGYIFKGFNESGEKVYEATINYNSSDSFWMSKYTTGFEIDTYKIYGDADQYESPEYYAFVADDQDEKELFKTDDIPAFIYVLEMPYFYENMWYDPVVLEGDAPPLVLLHIVLEKGYNIYTSKLRKMREATFDLSKDFKPILPFYYGGVFYIIIECVMNLMKETITLKLIEHWNQDR